jgi:hypothetical protein
MIYPAEHGSKRGKGNLMESMTFDGQVKGQEQGKEKGAQER